MFLREFLKLRSEVQELGTLYGSPDPPAIHDINKYLKCSDTASIELMQNSYETVDLRKLRVYLNWKRRSQKKSYFF